MTMTSLYVVTLDEGCGWCSNSRKNLLQILHGQHSEIYGCIPDTQRGAEPCKDLV